jgi:NitT/TauT family transport system substrate-binding protein/putative hydroxymethylpyrimidine transport system substrate-binding protein
MRRAVALLAAALALAGIAGCGGSGAEPGAPKGATLVLDFVPNAVHSGIYAAQAEGFYRDGGVSLKVQPPGESTDAPKLLGAGKVEFAILDIHDLGIAREKGIPLVGVMPIVQRPLAAVIARGDGPVRSPRDLEGQRVGVSGLPSDEAVVNSEVEADGGNPARVDEVTIGFAAVPSLAAGKVAAATGFWNAEAVALREQGTPIRVFKVDQFGAPPYPELVLCASQKLLQSDPDLVDAVVSATRRGYELTEERPEEALSDLLEANKSLGLNRAEQKAQLQVLLPALHPKPFDLPVLEAWAAWDLKHHLLEKPLAVNEAFRQVR